MPTQQENWNPPYTKPQEIGQYRAVLEPRDSSESMRRYWNGKSWSNPYSIKWPQELQLQCKKQISQFSVYWIDHKKSP